MTRRFDIGYHLSEGFKAIFTHGFMSFAAVCMIVACLLIMGSFSLVALNLDNMLGELEPAFAVTVHKAQGSEYRAVILAALDGAPMLMTRGVLYTAITRAKELFIIVGDDQAVERMEANNRQTRSYSGLRARLLFL